MYPDLQHYMIFEIKSCQIRQFIVVIKYVWTAEGWLVIWELKSTSVTFIGLLKMKICTTLLTSKILPHLGKIGNLAGKLNNRFYLVLWLQSNNGYQACPQLCYLRLREAEDRNVASPNRKRFVLLVENVEDRNCFWV